MHCVFTFSLVILHLTTAFAQSCFKPNGDPVTDPAFEPCGDPPTVCCATNRTGTPGSVDDARDICLPNGVCKNMVTGTDGVKATRYYRNYCTLDQWNSNECLNVCLGGSTLSDNLNSRVSPCSGNDTSTQWCCGDKTECCNPQQSTIDVLQLSQTLGQPDPSPLSSVPALSTASGTVVSISSDTLPAVTMQGISSPSSAASNSGSGLSTGAKAGIGIGATIGGLLVFALGIFFARTFFAKKHEQQRAKELPTHDSHAMNDWQPVKYQHLGTEDGSHIHGHGLTSELEGDKGGVELGRRDPAEMP